MGVKQSQRQLGLHGPPTLFNFFEFNVVRKPHYAIAHTRKLWERETKEVHGKKHNRHHRSEK